MLAAGTIQLVQTMDGDDAPVPYFTSLVTINTLRWLRSRAVFGNAKGSTPNSHAMVLCVVTKGMPELLVLILQRDAMPELP